MTFGEEIKKRLAEKGMRASELARRAQTSRQNISRLINDTPHPITGALPKAELETVERIAAALDWNLSDARRSAGFAPKEPQTRIQKLMAALEAQGIEGMDMFGGFNQLADMTDEQYDELVKSILMLVEISVRRNNDDPRGK